MTEVVVRGSTAAQAGGTRRRLLAGAVALPMIAAPQSPDAAMIAVCEGHPALWQAVNDAPDDVDEHCPIGRPYFASLDAIGEWQPSTLAGLLAKARVSLVEAAMPNGGYEPDASVAADWAWDVTVGLLRLHGLKVSE